MAVVLALLSALVWGASDFCGGLASRRSTAYAVVIVSALVLLAVSWAAMRRAEAAADALRKR